MDVHRLQSLEERLEDLDSLSLNILKSSSRKWLNKTGGRSPPRPLYGICGLKRHLEDENLNVNVPLQRMIIVILEVNKHLSKYCILLEIDSQTH